MIERVQTVLYARRLIVLLCLAGVLFAAITPGAFGLLCAVLVPIGLFFLALTTSLIRREAGHCEPQPFPFLSVVNPRAPPIQ